MTLHLRGGHAPVPSYRPETPGESAFEMTTETLTDPHPTDGDDTARAKFLALLLLAMAQFIVVIDGSIVNVALPSIGRSLHFSRTDLSWVVNAYTLTFGGFLLLGGRLSDLLGRRRMFMLGSVLFTIASFAGGIARSEGWLPGFAIAGVILTAMLISPRDSSEYSGAARMEASPAPAAGG